MENYLLIIDIIGIISFTISGYIIAVKNQLDILGIFLISFITALGGGIIRNTILHTIPFSFSELYHATIVISIIFFFLYLNFINIMKKIL